MFNTLIPYVASLIGVMTLGIGIAAMLMPSRMSEKFGIKATEPTLPYVVAVGVRDVFMGFVVVALSMMKLWYALGFVNLFLGVVAVSDFLVVNKHGDKKTSLVHLCGAIAVLTFGIFLIISN